MPHQGARHVCEMDHILMCGDAESHRKARGSAAVSAAVGEPARLPALRGYRQSEVKDRPVTELAGEADTATVGFDDGFADG